MKDLITSAEGTARLRSEQVFVDVAEFRGLLKTPASSRLSQHLGFTAAFLVMSGHQIHTTYRQSVQSKFSALQAVDRLEDVATCFIWVDTTRCGADHTISRLIWPLEHGTVSIPIAPSSLGDVEPRFIRLDRELLRKAIAKVGALQGMAATTGPNRGRFRREESRTKFRQLESLFVEEHSWTLSEFNDRLTSLLLDQIGLRPRGVFLSSLLAQGLLTDGVNHFLNNLDACIRVFNRAVGRLEQEGLDPQVKPVEPDYLPLHVACARDYRRLKLRHQIRGKDHFAVAGCKCGEAYSFYLGRSSLSIATLFETNRWSPDVSLPIFLNQLVSGHVAGKSSALYGLVLNAVMRDGLEIEPVPVLVPEQLGDEGPPSAFIDCLLYRYFFGLPQQRAAAGD